VSDLRTPLAGSRSVVTTVIADDESMFRASLRHLLAVPPSVILEVYGVDVGAGFDVVGEAGTGEETVATVNRAKPELLLLDLTMPRLSGLDVMRELHASLHKPLTLLLAGVVERQHLAAAIQLGVRGLVLKEATTELLFEAMMCVLSGKRWLDKLLVGDLMELVGTSSAQSAGVLAQPFGLTPRERQVLAHVVAGDGNKEIARKCAVSEETVKHHLTRIFDKVGASNRLELAMVATRRGLVSAAPDHV
jgi:two-component system, NarL family, nitrate/nitrite response regulator NarL